MTEISMLAQRTVIPVVIAIIAIATYTDCRWRLIKNVLTLPAIALGLLLHLTGSGWPGLYFSFLGLLAGLGLMLIPFMFGQMGAGDVKLMAALGSLLGWHAILNVFLYTTLAGGLLAIGFAVYHKQGAVMLRRTWHLAKGLFLFRTPAIMETEPGKSVSMPYGLAIAAGTLAYLIIGNVV